MGACCADEEMSAEDFARQTCLDCDLPVVFEEHIAAAIHTQVARARTIAQCPAAHHKTITVHVCHKSLLPQPHPAHACTTPHHHNNNSST